MKESGRDPTWSITL